MQRGICAPRKLACRWFAASPLADTSFLHCCTRGQPQTLRKNVGSAQAREGVGASRVAAQAFGESSLTCGSAPGCRPTTSAAPFPPPPPATPLPHPSGPGLPPNPSLCRPTAAAAGPYAAASQTQPLCATGRPPAVRRYAALAQPTLRPCSQPARHVRAIAAAAAAVAAAAAPADSSGEGSGSGLWARFSALANALTNLFPVFVLGAAVTALAAPTSFDWFDRQLITPALAVTMLGMGLTLTFDVRLQGGDWGHTPAASLAQNRPSLPCQAAATTHPHPQPTPRPQDFKRVLTTPGRILAGFALQYTVMPLMAFAVSRLAGLPLPFAIGWVRGGLGGAPAGSVIGGHRLACMPEDPACSTLLCLTARWFSLPPPPPPHPTTTTTITKGQAVHRGELPRRHRQQRGDVLGACRRHAQRGNDDCQHGGWVVGRVGGWVGVCPNAGMVQRRVRCGRLVGAARLVGRWRAGLCTRTHMCPSLRRVQLGAVVATPLLTQLLLGTLVPVDAAALLISTLQASWGRASGASWVLCMRPSASACAVAPAPDAARCAAPAPLASPPPPPTHTHTAPPPHTHTSPHRWCWRLWWWAPPSTAPSPSRWPRWAR